MSSPYAIIQIGTGKIDGIYWRSDDENSYKNLLHVVEFWRKEYPNHHHALVKIVDGDFPMPESIRLRMKLTVRS